MKIAFIGNCQMGAYQKIFETVLPADTQVEALETWSLTEVEIPAAMERMRDSDAIVLQPHYAPKHAPFRIDNIKREFPGRLTVVVHNLFLTGPFPDLVSIPPPPRSGLAGYHSRAVMQAFLEGRTEAEALEAFLGVGNTAEASASWDRSLAQFRKRQEVVDIPFDEEIEAFVRKQPCFHTFNHPNAFLLSRYAEKFGRKIFGQDFEIEDEVPDHLAWHGTWPIVPSVSAALGLPYASDKFIIPRRLGQSEMSFASYIEEAWGFYAQADRKVLKNAPVY